jgi:predicted Zn-ribbon and HTH transcriptional regulator
MSPRKRPKGPPVPSDRPETVRQEITALLQGGGNFTVRDISVNVGVSEREVLEHLAHIQRSLERKGPALAVTPAECRRCGFVFRKRERLKKPGKCPVCKSQSIEEPLFSIKG